jgi:hypothetical protein
LVGAGVEEGKGRAVENNDENGYNDESGEIHIDLEQAEETDIDIGSGVWHDGLIQSDGSGTAGDAKPY